MIISKVAGRGVGRVLGFSPRARQAFSVSVAGMFSFLMLLVLVHRFDAVPVLAICVLLGATVFMLVRPEAATLVMVALLYLNFPAVLTKQHGLPSVVAGSFILLLALPLLHHLVIRRGSLRADRTFHLMLLFLAVLLISSVTAAVDKSVALATVVEYLLEGVLIYWLILNVVRSVPTLRRVIWAILLAGATLSSLSLYQTVTGNYEQEFGGLAYRNYEVVQDEVRTGAPKREKWHRAQGSVNEPNRFAQILIVLLPLALFSHRHARRRMERLGAVCAGALLLAGIVLTLSRGAFVAVLLMVIALMAIRWVRPSRVLVCALLFGVGVVTVPFFTYRMSSMTAVTQYGGAAATAESRPVDSSSLLRMTVMRAAFRVFADHPFLGVGPGQFPRFYSMPYSDDPAIKLRDIPPAAYRAHSLYLELAAETGIIGLAVFLAVAATLLRALLLERRKWFHRNGEASDLATAFCLSILAYHTTGIFLHLAYPRYYWFLLAIAGAAAHMLSARFRTEAGEDYRRSPTGSDASMVLSATR
jgi:putative inorganic carbon (hco3(-)) transporter